ncbi:phage holin family protein [Niabella aquatica]
MSRFQKYACPTSRGLRKSFAKLLQYGGCIIVAVVILNIVYGSGENFGQQFAWLFGDLMLYLMIYTEVVSILENMEAMAPQSKFVNLFLRPVRRIITLQLKHLFREDYPVIANGMAGGKKVTDTDQTATGKDLV